MLLINSCTDVQTYVANCHADFVQHGLDELLTQEIVSANHPDYGDNWQEWLDANIDGFRITAIAIGVVARELILNNG